jgi:hypothetical protein
VRDVLDAFADVVVLDGLEVSSRLFKAQRQRPFGVDELFLDDVDGLLDQGGVSKDGAVHVDERRRLGRHVFVGGVDQGAELLVDGGDGGAQALDFAAGSGLFDDELRDLQIAGGELLAEAVGDAGIDADARQLFGRRCLFFDCGGRNEGFVTHGGFSVLGLFAELVVEKGGDVLDGAVFVGTVRRDGERRACGHGHRHEAENRLGIHAVVVVRERDGGFEEACGLGEQGARTGMEPELVEHGELLSLH